MNKKLIALAIAGACVAPAAMAQTANPVTLYGQVNVAIESVEGKGGATPISRRSRVSDNSSRFGVRGTEDLGGNLKAFFQLETAFKPDQNDTSFAQRNSAVGLQGSWGSVLIGRWDTPFKTTTTAVDPFGDITIHGLTGVMNGGSGQVSNSGNFDRRDQNVLQYWSPSWGGFAFRGMVMANENKTASSDPKDYGASLTYTGGPIYVGYAYEEHKDQAAGASAGPAAGSSGAKQDGNAVFGSFAFGPIKLGALYEEFKRTGFVKEKAIMGNVVWTIGSNQIIVQYMNAKDGQANGASTSPDCKSATAAWRYNFSRRTYSVLGYTKVDNNDAGKCDFGANRLGVAAGQDPQGVAFNLMHTF